MRLLTETEMLSVAGGNNPSLQEAAEAGNIFCAPNPNGQITIEVENKKNETQLLANRGGSHSRGGGGYTVQVKCGGRVEDAKNKDKEE